MKSNLSIANLFKEDKPAGMFGGSSGFANVFKPQGDGYIDVVGDYMWTLSPKAARSMAPYIVLKEFEVNEGNIKRSTFAYGKAAINAVGGMLIDYESSLAPYEELFPKDKPTGFRYSLPYFSDVNFTVSSPEWTQLDNLEKLGGMVKGAANLAYEGAGDALATGTKVIGGLAGGALDIFGGYPKIGIMDRPKMWPGHATRTTEIKFSLFNTVNADDWKQNRDLCVLLINQNLYNKRDAITSIPPVFYEIMVPGQHYSYASCVTNITISNRGNMRPMHHEGAKGKLNKMIVPDAYEVSIQLTDMVIPSKNMFQHINDGKVYTRITSK